MCWYVGDVPERSPHHYNYGFPPLLNNPLLFCILILNDFVGRKNWTPLILCQLERGMTSKQKSSQKKFWTVWNTYTVLGVCIGIWRLKTSWFLIKLNVSNLPILDGKALPPPEPPNTHSIYTPGQNYSSLTIPQDPPLKKSPWCQSTPTFYIYNLSILQNLNETSRFLSKLTLMTQNSNQQQFRSGTSSFFFTSPFLPIRPHSFRFTFFTLPSLTHPYIIKVQDFLRNRIPYVPRNAGASGFSTRLPTEIYR